METFALFDDLSAHAISFMPLSVRDDEKVDRIQVKSFIEDSSVTESATKGIWAAYSIIEKMSQHALDSRSARRFFHRRWSSPLIPASKKYYIVCDLVMSEIERQVTGESAGLAFCLKFVQHVLAQKKCSEELPAIAATGILNNRLESARIEKVKSINDKISAALSVLKQGDYFFYPQDNETDIDDDLRIQLNEQKINAIAVENVQKAVTAYAKEVLGDVTVTKPESKRPILKAALVFLFLTAAATAFLFGSRPTLDKIEKNLSDGDFLRAEEMLKRVGSTNLSEADRARYEHVAERIKMPLFAEIKFEYFPSQDVANSTSANPRSSLANVTLTMEDSYRFQVKPNADCYFYVFQFDSRDGVELLFPLATFATENHYLKEDNSCDIPGGGNTFFLLDGTHQGSVTLYFLATFWRARDIEKAYEAYNRYQAAEKKEQRDFIIERINQRIDAPNRGVYGVFVRKEYFLQK